MTALPILDLIAGLIFIYFLLAIVNNSLFELFASLFKLRSAMLKEWLVKTFNGDKNDASLANSLMNHPLLNGLSAKDKATTYIKGKTLGKTISELLIGHLAKKDPKAMPTVDLKSLYEAIDQIDLPEELASTFKSFITKTNIEKKINAQLNEIEHFENQITEWFDGTMERVGSRFKRKTFLFTATFASIITVSLNVDTLSLANYLYSNPEARAQWATKAYQSTSDTSVIALVNKIKANNAVTFNDTATKHSNFTLDSLKLKIEKERQSIDSIVGTLNANLPVGWTDSEKQIFKTAPIKKIGGWLITILAICVGAPFWFEVLGKIANIRSSIKPKIEEEKTVDSKKQN